MQMDRRTLDNYGKTKAEIRELQSRISALQKDVIKLQETMVSDSVSCGKKGKKALRTVKVQGIPGPYIHRKKQAVENSIAKLERLKERLEEESMQVLEYIESIDDSEMRMMCRLHYIDDLTWVQVAHRMNQNFPRRKKKFTEDSCRMKEKRFFEKNKKI